MEDIRDAFTKNGLIMLPSIITYKRRNVYTFRLRSFGKVRGGPAVRTTCLKVM